MTGRPASAEYLAGWLHDRLAEGGTSELGIHVKVAGDTVVLAGVVATPDRRDQIAAAVTELVPDLRIRNDVTVAAYDAPAAPEAVS